MSVGACVPVAAPSVAEQGRLAPKSTSIAGSCDGCGAICVPLGRFQRPEPNPCTTADGTDRCRGVTQTGKLWQKLELTVAFLEGDMRLIERVMRVADGWSDHAGIRFRPASSVQRADLRVRLRSGFSNSFVGTDNLAVLPDRETMNLGLSLISHDQEVNRVVLHEFGHALGLEHEHQNPVVDIPWDVEALYRYFASPPNGWSRSQVDVNVLQRVRAERAQFTAFDPSSIMLYYVPAELRLDRRATTANAELSAFDRQFIGLLYPGPNRVSAAAAHSEGLRLWNAKDVTGAFAAWEPAARQGLPEAQVAIAYCWQTGQGTARDLVRAAEWYRRAAEQGHAGAMVSLGVMLEAGALGTEQPVEAVQLFRNAADRGSPDGLYYLAGAYELGLSVPQSLPEAARLYGVAARLDHEPSRLKLRQMRMRTQG